MKATKVLSLPGASMVIKSAFHLLRVDSRQGRVEQIDHKYTETDFPL